MWARLAKCKTVSKMCYTTKSLRIRPDVLRAWNPHQVCEWAINNVRIEEQYAKKLLEKGMTGSLLLDQTEEDFIYDFGFPAGPAILLDAALAELKSMEPMKLLWHALLDEEYDEMDGAIQLRDKSLRWLTNYNPTLFVRPCHQELFNIINKLSARQLPQKGVVITGNPGIGKTWFLSYCLLRFAREKKTVFFESVPTRTGWLFEPNGKVTSYLIDFDGYPRTQLDDSNAYYMFDPYGGSPKEPLRFHAFTILVSYPNEQNYRKFLEQIGAQKYFMPCWSLEELEKILPYFPDFTREQVEARFHKFGGILRYVYSTSEFWDSEIEDIMAITSMKHLSQAEGGPERLPLCYHDILQYEENSDYRKTRASFLSDYIGEKVSKRLFEREKSEVLHFLRYSKRSPILFKLRQTFFEVLAHTFLLSGGKFKVRRLSDGLEDTLELPALLENSFSGDTLPNDSLLGGTLSRPSSKQFTTLDSFVMVGGKAIAFQYTVSNEPQLNLQEVKRALKMVSDRPLKVYFCVPPDVYPDFKAQLFGLESGKDATEDEVADCVEQFAFCMPLPEK